MLDRCSDLARRAGCRRGRHRARVARRTPSTFDRGYYVTPTVFRADEEHATSLDARIESGSIGINFYGSNLAAPFGGRKDSGLGTEYGPEGVSAYLALKSVHRLGRN